MPKVSVVVPVYNVEKYLAKCLRSVCEQTLEDIEILVVNDGSTDSSLQIIRKFAVTDPRIVVIDQQNQGLGYARNSALRVAVGEYVSFIDSDDWIDKGMMEAFYLEAIRTDADLVLGTFYEVSSNERTIRSIPMAPSIWQHKVPFSWRENSDIFYLPTPVWDKFYKRSLLEEHDIYFVKETCEDIDFKWKVFTSAQRISTLPEPMYYYRVRGTSLTSGKKVCVEVFRAHDSARAFLIARGLYEELKEEFQIREISEIVYLSWKARPALIADDITFTVYYNLSKKAFDVMNLRDINSKFPYLSFLYIFLFLHIKTCNDPIRYRAILRAWEAIAARHTRSNVKFGKFQLEGLQETSLSDDPWLSIDRSQDFFNNLRSTAIDKPHYPGSEDIKAAEIGAGYIVILPPVTAHSGDPVKISARMPKPSWADRLSFVAWTMQPERSKTLDIIASIDRADSTAGLATTVAQTMDPSTWYSLVTLDLTTFEPGELIELTLRVQGIGPFPFHHTSVHLSHFQFY